MATRHVSGDEYRRQKELDEARKAGLAPAALDEDGKEINPHIPEYMTSAPWYLNKDKPTLQHQRNWKEKQSDNEWYDRGAKVFQATKWRKGACENCGSMTHQSKDCLERPRNKGARWTNKNIAADEKVQEIHLNSWEAKRDRWNGFDAKEYDKVVERYDKLEAIRKEMKQKEEVEKAYGGKDGMEGKEALPDPEEDTRQAEDDDDAKIAEDEETGFGEVKKRVRTTAGGSTGSVRNLRIREDTAKYLLNLDVNSAHYDPKSRSMREDPTPNKPMNEKTFAGDNFVRKGGDFAAWQSMQLHSMQAFDKGQDVHLQANPSLAEMLYKQFKDKKEQLGKQGAKEVEDKYGNAAEKMPEDVAQLAATERYVEYDRMGRVIKGQEIKVRSRYEEDVLTNNHTAVWGSYWRDGMWGYACCQQHVKNSYCTGVAGAQATEQAGELAMANMEAKAQRGAEEELKRRQESKLNDYQGYVADVWGADTAKPDELDAKKVKDALKKLEERERAALEGDANKRKFNSLDAAGENVTAEEMEAFRLKKARADDPLAQLEADGAAPKGTGGYDYL